MHRDCAAAYRSLSSQSGVRVLHVLPGSQSAHHHALHVLHAVHIHHVHQFGLLVHRLYHRHRRHHVRRDPGRWSRHLGRTHHHGFLWKCVGYQRRRTKLRLQHAGRRRDSRCQHHRPVDLDSTPLPVRKKKLIVGNVYKIMASKKSDIALDIPTSVIPIIPSSPAPLVPAILRILICPVRHAAQLVSL